MTTQVDRRPGAGAALDSSLAAGDPNGTTGHDPGATTADGWDALVVTPDDLSRAIAEYRPDTEQRQAVADAARYLDALAAADAPPQSRADAFVQFVRATARASDRPGLVKAVADATLGNALDPFVLDLADGGRPEARSSWLADVDLDAYLDGDYEPPRPTHLVDPSGAGRLYDEAVNTLYGPSESGKSWIALAAAKQTAERGERVLYLDFESSPRAVAGRLAALGLDPDARRLFSYRRVDGALDHDRQAELLRDAEAVGYALVVLDGVTGMLTMLDLEPNSGTDIEKGMRWAAIPLAHLGACVVTIDHVSKAGSNGPIASQHKRAAVSGAAYEVAPVKGHPMRPGGHGKATLRINKDRPGGVRAVHPERGGVFHLDSTTTPSRAWLDAPATDDGIETPRLGDIADGMVQVSDALRTFPDDTAPSMGALKDAVGKRADRVGEAVTNLVEQGHALRSNGPRNATVVRLVKPFHHADADELGGVVIDHE